MAVVVISCIYMHLYCIIWMAVSLHLNQFDSREVRSHQQTNQLANQLRKLETIMFIQALQNSNHNS
jgi:hypothetical protein